MSSREFFPARVSVNPTIYAYELVGVSTQVYKFKRYEDSSLEYVGINRHLGENVGLYDTVLSRKEYEKTIENES